MVMRITQAVGRLGLANLGTRRPLQVQGLPAAAQCALVVAEVGPHPAGPTRARSLGRLRRELDAAGIDAESVSA